MGLESNIEKVRQLLAQRKQDLINALPQIAAELAESTLSMVKDRSINEGIEVEGDKKDYSTKQVYTSGFKKKTLNKAGQAYIEANLKGNWQGLRNAQGLRSPNVNLSYTNRMWIGIRVLSTEITTEGKAATTVGAVDEETQDKLTGNTNRYGDFLQPTPEELAIQQDVQKERINNILRGR